MRRRVTGRAPRQLSRIHGFARRPLGIERLEPRWCPSASFSTVDSDGSLVTLELRGPGTLSIETTATGDIQHVIVQGTDASSALVGEASGGDGRATLHAITEGAAVQGMGQIRLRSFDLVGETAQVDLPHGARSLVVDHVTAGHTTIRGSAFSRIILRSSAANVSVETTDGSYTGSRLRFQAEARDIHLDLAHGFEELSVVGPSLQFEAFVHAALGTLRFDHPLDLPVVRADSVAALVMAAPADFAFQIQTRSGIGSLTTEPSAHAAYTAGDRVASGPIMISGAQDLVVGRNGISAGTGTPEDPYVIESLDITSPMGATGISIAGTGDTRIVVRNTHISGGDYGVRIQNAGHIALSDLTIRRSGSGIMLLGAHDVLIDSSHIKWMAQHGIFTAISPDNPSFEAQTQNIAITRSELRHLGGAGVYVYGENTLIQDNIIAGAGDRGVAIYGPFRHTVLRGNSISESAIEGILVYGGDVRWTSTASPRKARDIWIYDNYLTANDEDIIELWLGVGPSEVAHNVIEHNLIANSINFNHMNGIELSWGAHGVEVYDNTIRDQGGDPAVLANGILIQGAVGNHVHDNRIDGVPGYGIAVVYDRADYPVPAGNLIEHNTVVDAGWGAVGFINNINHTDLAPLNTVR